MNIEKIYYKHYRYRENDPSYYQPEHYQRRKTEWMPSCKGGLTECHLVLSNGVEIESVAECSTKDNFCYATGCKIAYGRAMKIYENHYGNYDDYKNILSK